MRTRLLLGGAAAIALASAARATYRALATGAAPGRRKRLATLGLELGSRLLQRRGPLDNFHLYLVGFHPMRDDPRAQIEAHHYCRIIDEDLVQCIMFDGSGPDARLIGVEYIVSERLYAELPADERARWHPHNYEILSGELVAPGLPPAIEKLLMRRLLNGYGKTWHTWMTSGTGAHHSLPTGAPCLAWSFNRDREIDPALAHRRDARLGVSTDARRLQRATLAAHAHPQHGVDVLAGRFAGELGGRPDGVAEAEPRIPDLGGALVSPHLADKQR